MQQNTLKNQPEKMLIEQMIEFELKETGPPSQNKNRPTKSLSELLCS